MKRFLIGFAALLVAATAAYSTVVYRSQDNAYFQAASGSGTFADPFVQSAGALAAGSAVIGKVGIDQTTPGTTNAVSVQYGSTALVADPCRANTPTIKPITITTATTTNVLTGTAAKKIYVCYLMLTSAAADNVAIISGTTGATCGSNTAALIGGTTAANGLNFAANGGVAFGNGGFSVMQTQTNNDDICFITSAATPLAAVLKYVVQ